MLGVFFYSDSCQSIDFLLMVNWIFLGSIIALRCGGFNDKHFELKLEYIQASLGLITLGIRDYLSFNQVYRNIDRKFSSLENLCNQFFSLGTYEYPEVGGLVRVVREKRENFFQGYAKSGPIPAKWRALKPN